MTLPSSSTSSSSTANSSTSSSSTASDWYVYIIRSSDSSLYTGITTNLIRRWRQHCGLEKGGAKFFRGRNPVQVEYVELQPNRSVASQREAAIKKLKASEKQALITTLFANV